MKGFWEFERLKKWEEKRREEGFCREERSYGEYEEMKEMKRMKKKKKKKRLVTMMAKLCVV